MINWQKTVISQYQNSPVLMQLLGNFNSYFDPDYFSNSLYKNIQNLETASGYGLDIWGRIVGVSRTLNVASQNYLGFDGVTDNPTTPFNVGPLYRGDALTSNELLDDTTYRRLIYAKARANIWDGSIPGLNQILLAVFPGRGNCYAVCAPMSLTYKFEFFLTNVDAAIIGKSGVLPAPAGISVFVDAPEE